MQPQWKLISEWEDFRVFEDKTGRYAPEGEFKQGQATYRFILEPCTFENGVLSDNPYHKDHPAWFAKDLHILASFAGVSRSELIAMFTSEDTNVRARAYLLVGEYYGFGNLDQYPEVA
jgi:hypothetical protein